MKSARSTGRLVGVLSFVQLAGLTLPFILLMPITNAGFLENAAGISFQIKVAIFHLFANGLVTIGIAIAAFPILREHSYRAALWLVVISIIWFSMQAVDNAHILSMLSLSQQYNDGGGTNPELYNMLASVVRGTRKWVHYTELLIIDTWFFIFYYLLYRYRLVPRLLAAFGILAVILHAAGIPLPVFFDYQGILPLGFSLAVSHLAIGGWLIAKGFHERIAPETPSEA